MYVLVPTEVLAAIRDASHCHHPLETGGFLIGLRRGPHIEVTGLTKQAEGDIATRVTFDRAAPAHRERIHRAWRDSIETETLVGDWHSHPEGLGRPSATDRRAWRKLAVALKQPVLGLIESDSSKPNLYLATAARFRSVTELRPCEEGPDHIAFESAKGDGARERSLGMIEAERLDERIDALLRLAHGCAGGDFSGLGVIVAQDSALLPIFAIGPPIALNPEEDTAAILGAISRQQSPHHDGFHILNPALKLKAVSQYFSPPIVSRLKINRSAPFGGRYLAALFGSTINGVLATAIATPGLGVIIFMNGEEASRQSL